MPTLPALILLLIAVFAPLEQASAGGASLKLIWSKPVAAGYRAPGIILSNRIKGPDDSIGFLATGGLLTAPDESGLGPAIPLNNLKEKDRIILTIVRGKENTFWLGGRSNQHAYFPGGDISDAYLAKIDSQGHVIEERAYKSWFSFREIQELLPLDTGEVVIAENRRLAKIAGNGRVLWEKTFKPTKEVALSQIDHKIIIATIENDRASSTGQYQDNVVVRILGADGKTYTERVIRTGINEKIGGYFGNLQITASGDDAYVSSNWVDLFNAQPIEVSKISNKGNIVWQKKLASSISQNANKTWESCKQEQTVLANGNLLVACALKGEIFIYHLGSKTGDLKVNSVALPECHKNGIANLFLSQRENGKIWLFGSRPSNNVAASCTWLGELVLE